MDQPLDAEIIERLQSVLVGISRRIDRRVGTGGLTSTQLSILGSIDKRGPIGLSELAELVGVNPTMLSRVIGKLEQDGLVARQVDPLDRRAAKVVVTAAGSKLRKRLLVARSAEIAAAFAELPPRTAAELTNALPALEALAAHFAPHGGVQAAGVTR